MLVKIALPIILAFIMFSLGLGLRRADFSRVVKFPKAFAAGLFNQLLLLPIICFALVLAFGLQKELAVGMMILAFCPGGVTTNVLSKLSNGNVPLSISLTAVTSLLSIVTVPLLVALTVNHFMGSEAPPVNILGLGFTMFLITALPVLLGMLVTEKAPNFVVRRATLFSNLSLALFVLIVIAALAKNWEVVWTNLPVLGPALISLNIALLGVGILSSLIIGLGKRDASTIAIESGVQNGTLGIAVGALIVVSSETLPPTTVPSAVYGITMYLVTIPFVFLIRSWVKSSKNEEASQ